MELLECLQFFSLLNQAMKIERLNALQDQPYQRTESRQGYANGFKSKTVQTPMGEMIFDIPQVRGDLEFYPSSLEKGLRSERAIKTTLCEMYIQGVSTRKAKAVMEKLCGMSVSSTQVSRATTELDERQNGLMLIWNIS